MKILKNTTIVLAYLLLVTLFFGGGYALGRLTDAERVQTTSVQGSAEEINEESEREFVTPHYELLLTDGTLEINKCIGESKTFIMGQEISEGLFPYEDVAELKKGITFKRLEEAQQMYENFVS
jgi:hypothetical protein